MFLILAETDYLWQEIIMKAKGDKWSDNKYLLLLAAIVIVGFALRLFFITQHPLIYGDDGPYYLIHTNALLNGTETQFYSLIFYYFAFFSWAIGDLTLGIKIGTSLLSALSIIPLFLLAYHFTRNKNAALFAALLGMVSFSSLLIMSNTLKEVGGLLLGMFFVYSILEMLGKKQKDIMVKDLAIAATLFLLMFLVHFPSSLYFLSIILLFLAFKSVKEGRKSKAMLLLTLISISVLVGVCIHDLFRGSLVNSILALVKFSPQAQLINTRMIIYYLPLIPFSLVSLYVLAKSKAKIPDSSLLLIWLVAGFLMTQYVLMHELWAWRFELMNYTIMILLCSIGFLLAFDYNHKVAISFAALFLILESMFFCSYGMSASPLITNEEFGFLEYMKSILPANTVILWGYRETYNTDYGYWLEWTGFKMKDKNHIANGDYPVVLIEKGFMNYSVPSDRIINSSGKLILAKYQS